MQAAAKAVMPPEQADAAAIPAVQYPGCALDPGTQDPVPLASAPRSTTIGVIYLHFAFLLSVMARSPFRVLGYNLVPRTGGCQVRSAKGLGRKNKLGFGKEDGGKPAPYFLKAVGWTL